MDARLSLLRGTLDDANPLSKLRGNGLVLGAVFDDVDAFYERHIDRASTAFRADVAVPYYLPPSLFSGWTRQKFAFPEPSGIDVNMMPFRLFYAEATLPPRLHGYLPLIGSCRVQPVDYGPDGREVAQRRDRVAYLTVQESRVEAGGTQRRPGLHIDRPGAIVDGGRFVAPQPWGPNEYTSIAWGGGCSSKDGALVDGIYLATNVARSTRVFDALVSAPEEVTDAHGGVEHLRGRLGAGVELQENKLHWITDRTPHEALPMAADGDRQFFRLVVGRVSVWYAAHSTANPLCEPDAPVVHGSKFRGASPPGTPLAADPL